MTKEFARNKPPKREFARWRDLLLLTRSSAEMYFLNGIVQYDRRGGGTLRTSGRTSSLRSRVYLDTECGT